MALTISKTQRNGLETNYWRVIYYSVDRVTDQLLVKLAPYKDKDFRVENGPESYDKGSIISIVFYDISDDKALADLYTLIKMLPQDSGTGDLDWSRAEDA